MSQTDFQARRQCCRALASLPCLALLFASRLWAAEPEAPIRVEVSSEGDGYLIQAQIHAPEPPQEVWAVLTDFDHMASFLPNLSQSRITAKNGSSLTVAQKGQAKLAGMAFPFETVRELELKPFESVKSRLISGNMKKMNTTTTLHPESGGTGIHFVAEAVPDFWIPSLIGPSLMRHQVESQFSAILVEIQRRRQALAANNHF